VVHADRGTLRAPASWRWSRGSAPASPCRSLPAVEGQQSPPAVRLLAREGQTRARRPPLIAPSSSAGACPPRPAPRSAIAPATTGVAALACTPAPTTCRALIRRRTVLSAEAGPIAASTRRQMRGLMPMPKRRMPTGVALGRAYLTRAVTTAPVS
jgi:hypothetical protein